MKVFGVTESFLCLYKERMAFRNCKKVHVELEFAMFQDESSVFHEFDH